MEYETYLSVAASLVESPVSKVSKCKRVPGQKSLVRITNDECNGHVLNVFWPGFTDGANVSRSYSVYANKKM